MAKAIPEGFHSLTPYLIVRDGRAAMAFYTRAFGAKEVLRLSMPDGSIAHAEMRVGDSHVMLSEENPQWGSKGPNTLGGTPCGMCLYVEDCDAVFNQAVAAGGTVERPVMDQFYGDRSGTIIDPDGHKWTIATHKQDMTAAEMQKAMDEWMKSMPQG